ncbi:hypothetical protein ACFVWG_27005 [Kribbella sp. NPDC058245]|uniref:hypothetical protein n=1 Tax=Kribbella sp. NPDC058245 TaxID=3346399 RepID=UPI0036F06044
MPTMGELTAADWTAEFERNGRVVFPLRRRPYLLRGVVILLVFGPSRVLNLIEIADQSDYRRVATVIGATFLLLLIGLGTWQLITRRPILVVDTEGIHYGRKFMGWDAVGTAGIPRGPGFFRVLPVLPANVWAKELQIHRDNVHDLSAFSDWLNSLRPAYKESRGDNA